jgi:CcmD family protein
MENSGYLVAAYTIIWAVVFGYLLYMQWKQRKLRQQLDRLRETLEKKDG